MRKKTVVRRITDDVIRQEWFRQAHLSFNCQIGITCIFTGTALVGLVLLLSGQANPGSTIFGGGTLGAIVGAINTNTYRMSRDANERLDKHLKQRTTQPKPAQQRKRPDNDKAA